jgi:hypothetical protein
MPGPRGPIPKREEERERRNAPDMPVEHVQVEGEVDIPALGLSDTLHPLVVDLYESMGISGQAAFFEPTDWQMARVTSYFLDKLLKSSKPSAQMLDVVNKMLSNLMVTEGERRRLRLEIERAKPPEASNPVEDNVVDMYAKMHQRMLDEQNQA